MDPLTLIVTAVALGAAAGLKPTTEQAVKDAYTGLKTLIQDKYASAKTGVDLVEKDPKSVTFRTAAQELLEKTGAAKDKELLQKAAQVVEAVEKSAPETAPAIGVSLEDISGASLKIRNVKATGDGVRVEKATIKGTIEIRGVQAGKKPDTT